MTDKVYTVTSINYFVKDLLMADRELQDVKVEGEISGISSYPRYMFFTLKDESSLIKCYMSARFFRMGIKTPPENGMKAVVRGTISLRTENGQYQLEAKEILAVGEGDINAEYIKLQKKLAALGMFDDAHKKPIPKYITKLGVATGEGGRAIGDIKTQLATVNPHVKLVFCPTRVQGTYAPAGIVRAIKALDSYGVDLIIVGRGGGSAEELGAFNDERVANAVYECNTPIVSAVGHQDDFALIDFIADARESTPSSAVRQFVYDYGHFSSDIENMYFALTDSFAGKLENKKTALEMMKLTMERYSPQERLNAIRRETDDARAALARLLADKLEAKKHTLDIYTENLRRLSPLEKISGGYAYVSYGGKNLRSAGSVNVGDKIEVTLSDGRLGCVIEEKTDMKESRP